MEWLGKYELLRPIGKGGMAQLHLARAAGGMPGAHKLVVIKQMLPWLAEEAGYVEMFVDEARLALTLEHPNVVHVFDVGSAAGRYFFAMEYLHGEDVAHIHAAARAQGRVLPLGEALAVAIGVAAGLHYAHEKRATDGTPLEIVHRDVSPQNVVVTYDGAVKLLDFGIAKAAHRLTETRHGTIKGKVRYMAPEQIRSEEIDRRADVFALGVMLWELTTGRSLFDAPNEFALQRQIVDEDARRPSQVVSGYPIELERIVMRAVARRREERFESTEALQLALEEFARERKLAVSSVALARFMRELFTPRVEALREAQASGEEALTELVLAEIASRADSGESGAPPDSSAGGPGATRRMPLGPRRTPLPAAQAPAAAVASAPATPTRAPARTRRVALVASLGTAIAAAALVLVAQAWRAPAPPTAAAAPPPTAAAASTPATAASLAAASPPVVATPPLDGASPVAAAPSPVATAPSPVAAPSPAAAAPSHVAAAPSHVAAAARAQAMPEPRGATRPSPRHKRPHARAAVHGPRWDTESALPPP